VKSPTFFLLRIGCAILFAAICATTRLQSQERPFYESRLVERLQIRGSQLVMCPLVSSQDPATASVLVFQFKRRAYGVTASDVAASWYSNGNGNGNGNGNANANANANANNNAQNKMRRSTLRGASVFASVRLGDSSCAVLFEQSDTLFVGEVQADLSLTRQTALPLASTASASVLTFLTNDGGAKLFALGNGRTLALSLAGELFWCNFHSIDGRTTTDSIRIQPRTEYTLLDIVAMNPYTRNDRDPACALLRESGLRKDVVFLSERGIELAMQSLDEQQQATLRRVSNYTVALCAERPASTLVTIVQCNSSSVTRGDSSGTPAASINLAGFRLTTGIAAPADLIAFTEEKSRISIVSVDNSGDKFVWNRTHIPLDGSRTSSEILWTFPDNVFAPQVVLPSGDEFLCVFANELVIMDNLGKPVAMSRISTHSLTANKSTARLEENGQQTLYLLQLGRDSFFIARDDVPFWWLRNIVRDVWLYGVLLCIVGIILALLTIVQYQRRLLTTLFGADDADAMLILDAEGKLQSLNDTARTVLSIAVEAPLRRLFQFYCAPDDLQPLNYLVRDVLKLRVAESKYIKLHSSARIGTANTNSEQREEQDYLFSAVPIRTRFGSMRGILLQGKDITEELGREKWSNWAQLAHDLQTNLAAARLNAEIVTGTSGKMIVHQITIIQQRIKDIIDIGKYDELKIENVDFESVCIAARKELDHLYRNITFTVEAEPYSFDCDKSKLVRALRNAIENGIRAMDGQHFEKQGTITIRAWYKDKSVWFQVQDTGAGMSEDVVKNMTKKGFTTFGAQGGSGMGTGIMLYVMKLLEGEMLVDSSRGVGTRITFKLPGRNVRVRVHAHSHNHAHKAHQKQPLVDDAPGASLPL
jgi:signal transduction histidine kinase